MTLFEEKAREHADSRNAKETQSVYKSDLGKWLAFCGEYDVDPNAPTISDAAAFREELKTKFAKTTVRRILAALSAMYDHAGLSNCFAPKRLPRPPSDAIGVTTEFSPKEVDSLFAAVKTTRERAIMSLLFGTGLRIGEILAIRQDELHKRSKNYILIATVKKKGRVETVLPKSCTDAVEAWLDETGAASDWLFPGRYYFKHLSASWFRTQLKEIAERAGVKNVHPHRFRATFITESLDAGIPLNEVQAAVHHADPKTTQRYDRGVRGTGVTTALEEFRKGRK